MDINFKEEEFTFNYRVAALIRYQDKLLVEKNIEVEHYGLIGGRCKLGEDSITALQREVLEETNEETEYVRTVGILENFFTSRYTNSPYHEILIIHELKFKNPEVYKETSIINLEEKKLQQLKVEPSIVFKHLEDQSIFHFINKN